MNLLTITSKKPKAKKYNVSIDVTVLERIAGSLGLFQSRFVKDIDESLHDIKANRFVPAKNLKDLR